MNGGVSEAFVSAVVAFVTRRTLILPDSRVLIALSGGPDSSALTLALYLAAQQGLLPNPVATAHFHHGLRGSDADQDAAFASALSVRLGLPCVVGIGTVHKASQSPNAAARESRYAFLREAALEWGANRIATAHTANDQAETVLGRVLRGTSIEGLAGIPASRTLTPGLQVIRPLLTRRRAEVDDFCREQGITPRTDPSNFSERYTRTRLRRTIPILAQDFNPRLVETLNRLAETASLESDFLEEQTDRLWQDCVREVRDFGICLDLRHLVPAHSALRKRVLRMALERLAGELPESAEIITADWIQQIEQTATGERSALPDDLPGGIRVRREDGLLWILRF
ncbi:MAG: hypothetical protein OHK0029_25200 [Armatimonadaceae bacterium]